MTIERKRQAAGAFQRACRSALGQGFLGSTPHIVLDERGYVSEPGQNLIDGVELAAFESDLRQGDGNELKGRFRAAHSSSALAVNTFAPFKANLADLWLPAGGGFDSLSFERKCPHGVKNDFRPPNIDVVFCGPSSVVAVESKCLEPLKPKSAKFSPAYEADIRDGRRQTAWFHEMLRLRQKPRAYRCLDAAQLVKHAFGIANTFRDRLATLLYLYWEPSNQENYPIFAEHRAEVSRFAAAIRGGGPEFAAVSYRELWRAWDAPGQPEWLRTHVGRLRARYEVAA
jgi:hypothetical protein